ncbi:MAG: OsmC family protein [Flammeovirgaceae bacterium]
MEYLTTTRWNEGFHFTSHFDGYDIPFDATAIKGNDKGVSPKTMLLSALAGCTGMDVVAFLQQKFKVPFSDFSLNVKGELTAVHPKIFNRIHVTYTIRVRAEDKARVHEAVNFSATKYCGVQAMLGKAAQITNEIVFL